MIEDITPNYNDVACNIFEEINRRLGWSGQYGSSGGEYHIVDLGYYVDYYEPTMNVVIEYDESHHSRFRKKDKLRQSQIVKKLGCKFYRITPEFSLDTILTELKNIL